METEMVAKETAVNAKAWGEEMTTVLAEIEALPEDVQGLVQHLLYSLQYLREQYAGTAVEAITPRALVENYCQAAGLTLKS